MTAELIDMTAEIVAAYVGHNNVAPDDVSKLIELVHGALEQAASGEASADQARPDPAVPVDQSITAEYLICLEDGKKFKSLKRHIRTHYDLSPEEYRARWGLAADYPMVAPSYAKARSRLAKKMGLPISQLVIATNRNDILHRFVSGNKYEQHQLEHTLSPSMDIMVSSNFERLLFDLHGRDGLAVKTLLENAAKGPVSIEDYRWKLAVDDKATCDTIREIYEQNEYLLDPHTAIGVRAARNCRRDQVVPMITLGTAHPAKFPDAVAESGVSVEPPLPAHMADLFEREERYTVLDNNIDGVQAFIAKHWKNA